MGGLECSGAYLSSRLRAYGPGTQAVLPRPILHLLELPAAGLLLVLLSHGLELQKCYPLRRSYMHEDIDKYRECTRDDMNDMVQCIYIYTFLTTR